MFAQVGLEGWPLVRRFREKTSAIEDRRSSWRNFAGVVDSPKPYQHSVLADIEPTDGSDPEPGGGFGISSFLSSAPRAIGSITALIGAVTGLLIALNKVGILGDDGGGATTTTTKMNGSEYFQAFNRPQGSVYFEGKTMYVKAAMTHPLVVPADPEKSLQDVAMTVRAKWVSGATGYGVGLICRYRSNSEYYLLSVLTGGRYNIVRYRDVGGKPKPFSLTKGIQFNDAVDNTVNDLSARCVGDNPTRLTLKANGVELGSVDDPDGIESGNIGVRMGSTESVFTLSFDDFVLKFF